MKNMNSLINEYYSLTYSVRVKIVIFRNRIEVEYNISPRVYIKIKKKRLSLAKNATGSCFFVLSNFRERI